MPVYAPANPAPNYQNAAGEDFNPYAEKTEEKQAYIKEFYESFSLARPSSAIVVSPSLSTSVTAVRTRGRDRRFARSADRAVVFATTAKWSPSLTRSWVLLQLAWVNGFLPHFTRQKMAQRFPDVPPAAPPMFPRLGRHHTPEEFARGLAGVTRGVHMDPRVFSGFNATSTREAYKAMRELPELLQLYPDQRYKVVPRAEELHAS